MGDENPDFKPQVHLVTFILFLSKLGRHSHVFSLYFLKISHDRFTVAGW